MQFDWKPPLVARSRGAVPLPHRKNRRAGNFPIIQTIKNETNEKRLITMRNDLTNAEVENKKLTNTLALLEKNMCKLCPRQLMSE